MHAALSDEPSSIAIGKIVGRGRLSIRGLILFFWCCLSSPVLGDSPVTFEATIRPFLKAHCFHCHGEEAEKQGGLDLRLVRTMQQGGDSGVALIPGQLDQSLIWKQVETGMMPPSGKGLNDTEKELLRRWITEGAQTLRPEPDALPEGPQWTEEERNFWSLQPVTVHPMPAIDPGIWIDSPVDSWVAMKQQPYQLTFSESASPPDWLRRITFDLLGIPPTWEEIEAFCDDPAPDARQRVVDRLLANPRFGERWGRHWLDVAGYADSDGYTEADAQRPWAFHYRDYVIDAHNADLPIDRFLEEQLAGDELVATPWENLTLEQAKRLAATGFLRMVPDGTGQEGVDANVARNDVIAETIKVVSSGVLGLTVGCAQCHHHRYDPISQEDYYRLRAVFEPGLDWKQWRDRSQRLVSLWNSSQREQAAKVDQELSELEGKRVAELDGIVQEVFDKELAKLPEAMREPAKVARNTPADKRTEDQKKLMQDFPSLNVDRGSVYLYEGQRLQDFNKRYEQLQSELRGKRPPENFVSCFSEVPGHLPPTHRFFRGDFQQPREVIAPGGLSVLGESDRIADDDAQLSTSGRRLALIRTWTSGTHPLVTRVQANRLWAPLFGRGIVATPGDFGRLGEAPSHPELLDWMAEELVRRGWSRKQMLRELLLCRTYGQTSVRTHAASQVDPENTWLSHQRLRRLETESIRDSMLAASGMLQVDRGGPAAAVNPDEVGQFIVGKATRDGNGILVAKREESPELYRRSIYIEVRRSMPLGMLEPFDPAATVPNCERRSVSTVAPQSLLLMNHAEVIRLSEAFARRVRRDAGEDPAEQIRHAWRLALGRQPPEDLLADATQWLTSWKPDPAGEPASAAAPDTIDPALQPLALYCQAIFSSNPFLYID
jgi:hypothetical protein